MLVLLLRSRSYVISISLKSSILKKLSLLKWQKKRKREEERSFLDKDSKLLNMMMMEMWFLRKKEKMKNSTKRPTRENS